MGPRTFVIVNPLSGGGRTGRRWPQLRRALDPLLDTWDHAFTLGPQDATRLARQAVEQGYEQVVAVGGDGTQHEVVNGLFRVEEDPKTPPEPLRPDLVFVPVRFGTGGDFARHLGLPARLPAAVQHIESGRTRPVDLGVVAFVDRTGAPRRQIFVNVASFGLSGLVDQKVNASTKRLGGLSFLSATFRALAEFRPVRTQIRVDGQPFYEGRVVTAAAANGTTYGGGMRVAPRACIDDGLLDLVVQTRAGLYETARVRQLYDGRSAEWPSVRIGRGRVIEAETLSRQPVLLDVDGEALGVLPARFEVLPGSLRLKAP
ncbi:MAG TPA: diacylglycerol kinase family lipid kinase [Myxococcales bacterium LLY-WYZ-16_1]|nr:diacylglycerol kinase family lipid kinase [Myxococcales bacterium LLY-WYZ-16_1]